MGFLIAFLFLFLIIFIFSSKTFSPIPYFPSQKKDLPLIIKALNLQNDQTVFDLGAGDGIIIFEASRKAYEKNLNTKFVAVEINPVLILILYFRRLFHPNKKNIKIILDDIFKMNFKRDTLHAARYTFYLYISPWFLEKVIKNLKLKIKNFRIVSYMYPVKSLKRRGKNLKGKNNIYMYE